MCGVLNLRLRQRGHNQLENKLLQNYLKSFSVEKQNIEQMLLNQMHAIKSLVNRRAFSISDVQISMIHNKFKNYYHQRLDHNDGILIHDDSPVSLRQDSRTQRRESLPKELEYHELEESRAYRMANERRAYNSNSKVSNQKLVRNSDSFIGRGSHHAVDPLPRASVNSRRDLGDSFIGRGSHHAAAPLSPRNAQRDRKQEDATRRVRSPLRHDEGMDELQKFLDFKPVE